MSTADPFQRARRGDPLAIPASTYNAMLDAAEANRAAEIDAGDPLRTLPAGWVLVRNQSGSAVARFEVLGIDAPTFTPTAAAELLDQRRIVLDGVTPAAAHLRSFVVLQEPLPDGAIGRAVLHAPTPATVNVTNTDHTHAIAAASSTKLVSSFSGPFELVWHPGTTGDQPALLRPSPASAPGVLFAVTLTQTGGTQGDASTQPSYTYTATDLAGNQLGTDLAPQFSRALGAHNSASHGVGYFDASGDFVLVSTDERPQTAECPA